MMCASREQIAKMHKAFEDNPKAEWVVVEHSGDSEGREQLQAVLYDTWNPAVIASVDITEPYEKVSK